MLSIEKQILYLLTRVSVIEVQELVRIYEGRGYSSQYIRNVLSQLKKDGYVESPFRSTYKIKEHVSICQLGCFTMSWRTKLTCADEVNHSSYKSKTTKECEYRTGCVHWTFSTFIQELGVLPTIV